MVAELQQVGVVEWAERRRKGEEEKRERGGKMRKKEKEEKTREMMMQMQWVRGEEESLPGSGVRLREMVRESAAAAGGVAMGGRAAAARLGFRGVAAACDRVETLREVGGVVVRLGVSEVEDRFCVRWRDQGAVKSEMREIEVCEIWERWTPAT